MQKTQLALFPLQIFLLPGEKTVLHIFEERYRQLLNDCENIHFTFGIPHTSNGYFTGLGCVVELKKVIERYPNGSSDIEVEAIQCFKMDQFYLRMGDKLYPGGDVSLITDAELTSVSPDVLQALSDYYQTKENAQLSEFMFTNLNAFDVARIINLGEADKIRLVKAAHHEKRERILIENLKFLRIIEKQRSSILGDVFLN